MKLEQIESPEDVDQPGTFTASVSCFTNRFTGNSPLGRFAVLFRKERPRLRIDDYRLLARWL
jgi:hypothetical protein